MGCVVGYKITELVIGEKFMGSVVLRASRCGDSRFEGWWVVVYYIPVLGVCRCSVTAPNSPMALGAWHRTRGPSCQRQELARPHAVTNQSLINARTINTGTGNATTRLVRRESGNPL